MADTRTETIEGLERAPDLLLLAVREVYIRLLTEASPTVELPAFPPLCMLALVNEIIEQRAVAAGAVDEVLKNLRRRVDGASIADRPTDARLRELVGEWREIAVKGGPSYPIDLPALALLTLADELIELRKAPRA